MDVQQGSLKRSSSGIRGGRSNDPNYRILRLITPVFHVLNSLVTSHCKTQNTTERVYSLFTLAGGLQNSFKLSFQFNIDNVGQLSITATLRLQDSSGSSYATGAVDVQINNMGELKPLSHSYREVQGEEQGKNYYTYYTIDDGGRIIFPQKAVKFVTDDSEAGPAELFVHWSAVAEGTSCLLKQNSPVPKNKPFYIRLRDRGYCDEDCSSADESCNLFCVDESILLSHQPSRPPTFPCSL